MAVIQIFLTKFDLISPGNIPYSKLSEVKITDFKIDAQLFEKAHFVIFVEKDIRKVLKIKKQRSFAIPIERKLDLNKLQRVFKQCTKILKTSITEIRSAKRTNLIAKKRIAIGAFLADFFIYNISLYNEKHITLKDIGSLLKRNHSTIIYYKRINSFDEQIVSFIEELNLLID